MAWYDRLAKRAEAKRKEAQRIEKLKAANRKAKAEKLASKVRLLVNERIK